MFKQSFPGARSSMAFSLQAGLILWVPMVLLGLLFYRVAFKSWESRRTVSESDHLGQLARHMRRLKSKWLAPRSLRPLATVVKVTDRLWKQMVSASLKEVDCAVIDCTYPSEAILWELRECVTERPGRTIVTLCTDPPEPDTAGDSEIARCRDLIKAFERSGKLAGVITYSLTADPRGSSFQKQLAAVLKIARI